MKKNPGQGEPSHEQPRTERHPRKICRIRTGHHGKAAGKRSEREEPAAVRVADRECGDCGCDFDPLYKKALILPGA